MYSYEERIKAVKLYMKYEHSLATTIHKLGYPSPKALYGWYKEYELNGDLHNSSRRSHEFTQHEKKIAVDHYLEYGRNYSRTVRMLGYPSRETLRSWCKELAPEARKIRRSKLNYSQEQKTEAVMELAVREISAKKIAERYHVSRKTLYDWKSELVGKELPPQMSKLSEDNQKNNLKAEVENLEKQVYQLKMEKAILEKSADLIKKERGINPLNLSNKEKTIVIDALLQDYPLTVLLLELKLAKSSYHYHRNRLRLHEKYVDLRSLIKEIFIENYSSYGYRRIHAELKNRKITVSEKVIRRLMEEEELIVRAVPKKRYSSYAGEITPATPNVSQRNFKAEVPNEKWLTDITEFRIPSGKVYLSPIIDCFDGAPVSWSIGTSPNAKLVNDTSDSAQVKGTIENNGVVKITSDKLNAAIANEDKNKGYIFDNADTGVIEVAGPTALATDAFLASGSAGPGIKNVGTLDVDGALTVNGKTDGEAELKNAGTIKAASLQLNGKAGDPTKEVDPDSKFTLAAGTYEITGAVGANTDTLAIDTGATVNAQSIGARILEINGTAGADADHKVGTITATDSLTTVDGSKVFADSITAGSINFSGIVNAGNVEATKDLTVTAGTTTVEGVLTAANLTQNGGTITVKKGAFKL